MNREELFDDLFGDKPKHELGKHTPENKKYAKENLPVKYSAPQAQKQLRKQFKKLRHKALYLNMEHEELIEEFEEVRHIFISKMLEYCKDKKIEDPFESVSPEAKQKENLSDKNMNDLFREIVKKTHPDLNKDLPQEEMEEMVDLYNEAVKGKQGGDLRKILQVALELNVQIKNITPKFIQQLRSEIQKMQKNIKQIKNDIMYKWSKSDKKTKQQIFELLTKNLKPL
tara:strand:+ start:626 stop:1306 length:681 start_codon:yes stop_codon:yes gene_type:complete